MKKTAIILIILTLFSKSIGFFREITLAYFYGASSISDAYLISLSIPTIIFAFIGTALSTAYIPMYIKIKKENGSISANDFTNNLINVLLIICTILVLVGMVFTEQIVRIFAIGFVGETLKLAVTFTRVSLFGMYFTFLVHLFNAFLQIKGNYVIPALVGLPLNFFIITSIILSSRGNIFVLALGILIATIGQFIFLLPSIYKNGFRYKMKIDIIDSRMKELVYLGLPVILGVAVNDINAIVDRTIASQLATGGISALNYAQKLNTFVQGVIVLSIATAMYPLISKMATENNSEGLKKTLRESITGINLLVVPCTIGALVFSQPIIEVLFARGAFDYQAIKMTSNALFFYALGMTGIGLRQILSRPFYALQDTKTPVINASIGMTINIALNIILSRYLGIGGLALATSISATLTAIFLFISLRKKIGGFGLKQISISFIKILLASLIMGLLANISFEYLTSTISQSLSLIIAIVIGMVSYFIIIHFMKIEDFDILVLALKKKFGQRIG